jgi:hypothetical protein
MVVAGEEVEVRVEEEWKRGLRGVLRDAMCAQNVRVEEAG